MALGLNQQSAQGGPPDDVDTNTLCKEATPVKVPLTPVTQAGSHEVLGGGGQSQKGP